MGKYEPLKRYLEGQSTDSVDANFAQLEAILGFSLPQSAYRHQAWWANEAHGSHSHSRSWQDAGWETRQVNTSHHTVRFERARRPNLPSKRRASDASDLDALWTRAIAVSGTSDRDEILRRALTTFIQREAGRQLALLGGSMPDLEVPQRESPPYDRD